MFNQKSNHIENYSLFVYLSIAYLLGFLMDLMITWAVTYLCHLSAHFSLSNKVKGYVCLFVLLAKLYHV